MMDADAKLAELFIDLPEPTHMPAGIVAAFQVGKIFTVEGALPFQAGRLIARGRVGLEVPLEKARLAARASCLQALGVIAQEFGGSLKKVSRVVSLVGYISSSSDFHDHLKVLESASDLLLELFGKKGTHVRRGVGVTSLPQGAACMLTLSVELK